MLFVLVLQINFVLVLQINSDVHLTDTLIVITTASPSDIEMEGEHIELGICESTARYSRQGGKFMAGLKEYLVGFHNKLFTTYIL